MSQISHIDPSKLQEFGSKYEAETLRNPKRTDLTDVIVYVHDSSDTNSFSYISNLRVRSICLLFHDVADGMTATVQSGPYTDVICGNEVRSRPRPASE